MLRPLLLATSLLAASGAAFAHGDHGYGRVVTVEPRFVVSFGTPYPDGFRVLVESGGTRYWTYSPYYPGPTIVLPPRPYHEARHVHRHHDYGRGWDERREHHRKHRRHDDDD